MKPGDLLLYRGDATLASRLIRWRTKGPFAHCEIAVSPTHSIAALDTGIVLHQSSGVPGVDLTIVPLDLPQLEYALAWIKRRVGSGYGWGDIADFALDILLPHGPFLINSDRFTCSDLCTRFLALAGCDRLPDRLINCPQLVSPNDLARAFKVI